MKPPILPAKNEYTVLIAEDDRTIRQMIVHAMRQDSYRTLDAENGQQALDLYYAHQPDIVLLDAMMPQLGGIDVCRRINNVEEAQPLPPPPTLIITALEDRDTINQAFEAGAIDYLTKPIHWLVLRHRVRRLLQNRKTERSHRESEQKYRALFEQTNDGVFFLDFDGVCIGVNQQGAEMLGYTVEQVIGLHTTAFAQPYSRIENEQFWQTILAGKAVPVYEEFFIKQNGVKFPVEINLGLAYNAVGEPLHVQVIARDITERRELETARAEFIGVTSHELRTPLTSVMGFLQTLLGEKPGPLTELQREFLEISYESSQQLSALVNDLLDVTRLEGNRLMLNLELVDLANALDRAAHAFSPAANEKNISISLNMPPNLSDGQFTLEADRVRIEQIIDNLVSNAVKFTAVNGSVTLTLSETLPGAQLGGRNFQATGFYLQVSDNGLGISAKDISGLFKRFYRAANAQSQNIEGTGLGLYITKGLVERHQGYIWVESEEGVGATFHVWLPVRQANNLLISSLPSG